MIFSADSQLHASEPLVSLQNVSDRITVSPYYFLQKYPGAVNDCFVREGVMKKLISISNKLPHTYHLVILDGWRSYETQLFLYEETKKLLEERYETKEEALSKLSCFVSFPSKNPRHPSPHYTGGAVDLTIADENGPLNMGTMFDEFIDAASTEFYENRMDLTSEEALIRDNRRKLKQLLESEGFVNQPDEWWHYEYGTIAWAEQKQITVKYGGIEL